ncbi:short-subunit dehydrogenase [Pontibacter ummariensis]|uniref:Short-chain dehydrogenase n=1 Tax=Pontibacter ummariensis TaxID=1610492 RepID=A0A239C361_9BACT|nr:oxidoreductase [Pontibacter ummariensis]PRY15487.1 short-subunit dehydrogenase [Pontibacter ummariensis]SNS14332.1 Short-chain dehydrogenase [Pontibacter ummariensis]
MAERVWFITGVSSGFGRKLAEEVAKLGDKVIGTVRQVRQLEEFNAISPGNTFAYLMDVTNAEGVKATTEAACKLMGRIDVLVNNAGFGYVGAVEEAPVAAYRDNMETNFFGALQVTQRLLPYMREQGGGHIIQMSSIAGFRSSPGFSVYNASKFALEGMSEALAMEVAPFNIKVTIVEPGPFRTNFGGSSIKHATVEMEAYAGTAGAFKRRMSAQNGEQEGDPLKAARVIIDVVNADNPPLRLPLGQYAIDAVRAKLEQVAQDLRAWEAKAGPTSFTD